MTENKTGSENSRDYQRIQHSVEYKTTAVKITSGIKGNSRDFFLISPEVENLLKKGAIEEVQLQRGQFLSSIFLEKKKDGGTGRFST